MGRARLAYSGFWYVDVTTRQSGDDDGPSNPFQISDGLFRMVAIVGLLLGSGSSVLTISSTDDRYRAADAQRDLQIRDERITTGKR